MDKVNFKQRSRSLLLHRRQYWNSLWNDRHQTIHQDTLIRPIPEGGLGVTGIQRKLQAMWLVWVLCIFNNNTTGKWRTLMRLKKLTSGGRLVKFPILRFPFYKQLLKDWIAVADNHPRAPPSTRSEILCKPII